MKLDVKDLVLGVVGNSEQMSLELFGEELEEGIKAEKIRGQVKLIKLETGLLAQFTGKTKIKLECDRCLNEYELELDLNFKQEYVSAANDITDEKLEITKDFKIDITEPIRQEIITRIPVKKLCKNDCAGICLSCGKNLNMEKCNCKKEK